MGFRPQPPGVVEGPIDEGSLNLAVDCARGRGARHAPDEVHADRPAHAGKTLLDQHYRDPGSWRSPSPTSWPSRCSESTPTCIQIDEANIPGHPDEGTGPPPPSTSSSTRSEEIQGRVHLCFGNYGGQSIQKGTWGKLIDYLNAPAMSTTSSWKSPSARRRSCGVQGAAPGDRPRPGRDRHQADRDRKPEDVARAIERPTRSWARDESATSTPTAASGCSSATWPTARCARWSRAATFTRGAPPRLRESRASSRSHVQRRRDHPARSRRVPPRYPRHSHGVAVL